MPALARPLPLSGGDLGSSLWPEAPALLRWPRAPRPCPAPWKPEAASQPQELWPGSEAQGSRSDCRARAVFRQRPGQATRERRLPLTVVPCRATEQCFPKLVAVLPGGKGGSVWDPVSPCGTGLHALLLLESRRASNPSQASPRAPSQPCWTRAPGALLAVSRLRGRQCGREHSASRERWASEP